MSVEAYTWALNLAPVPMDEGGSRRGRQPNSACAFVLVGLANHADPAGRDAFPSVSTLMRYTRLSERTVRTALDRLEAEGIIRPGDPAVVAAKIKRVDRRTQGWDLAMERMRDDLSDEELDKIGNNNPWLKPWIEANRPKRGATAAPRDGERGATAAERGATVSERGATAAPEPSGTEQEPSNIFALFAQPGPEPKPVDRFPEFWAMYPIKDGKAAAVKAWAKATKTTQVDVIFAGLQRYLRSDKVRRGVIAHASTWLNQERWTDKGIDMDVIGRSRNIPEGWG